jgi:hypothetical protein
MVTRLQARWSGLDSWQGAENFLFATMFKVTLGPTQPPIHWVLDALPLGWSGQGMKLTTHLHLVPRLRMCEAIPPLYHTSSWRCT